VTWDRSSTIALAKYHCSRCHGLGMLFWAYHRPRPCPCVLRTIFHACLTRYRHAQARKEEEYCADFVLLAKRILDPWHFRLFRIHFLGGRPWSRCIGPLRTNRGFFFHCVYRVQEILGRALAELLPYPLWPLDHYFHSNHTLGPLGIVWRPQSTQHYRAIDPDRLPSSNPNGRPRGLNYHIHTELRQAAAAHAKE